MLKALVALVIASSVLAGQQPVESGKRPPRDVGPGRVAWFDLTTSSLARSKEFYGKLFGWTFAPLKETDHAVEIVSGGEGIGTLRVAEGAISAFNGVVYLQVNDAQAACTRARELGATIAPGFPFNLAGGIGAICLVLDPAGHPVGMYARTPLPAHQLPRHSFGSRPPV